jgi:putative peptidoglycan lipid II flippase
MKISACIITLNEERNLSRCLKSLASLVDEIVVVDSGSTDETRTMARQFGARVVPHAWAGYVAQKNFALDQASHPWVLSIDADEEISPELGSAIAGLKVSSAVDSPKGPNGYRFSRLVYYRAHWIKHGDWYPDRLVRLFRRSEGRFTGGHVHEKLELPGEHPILPGHLHHFTYANAEDRNARCARYAELWAQSAHERGKCAGKWSPPLHAVARFAKGFFLKAGFLDGPIGWDIAEGNAREVWLKYDLLRKMNAGKDLDKMSDDVPEQGSLDLDAPKPPEEPMVPEEAIPLLTGSEPSNPEMSDPQPVSQTLPGSKKRSSKRSAVVVGASVMGSRLMGVVREQIFAFMFGTTMFADAFIAAFRIPNLLRDLFAEGALSTAFTTTFTKTWEKEGADSAWHLARLVLSALTLILGAICIVCIIFGPEVVDLTSSGWGAKQPETFALTVKMTRLLFPFILFVSLAAAVMGVLNSRHVFGIPASASTVFNIVSVVGGLIFAIVFTAVLRPTGFDWHHPQFGQEAIFGWCFGVLLGGLAQLGMQLPSLWQLGFRYKWQLDFKDSALRTVMILMVPSAIAGSAVQVNVLVNGQFASYIPGHGPVSWLYYAFRLVQLPIGIFGVAIATVTLPAVARQHALDDLKAFGKTVEEALRFGFYLTLPASVGLAVVAQPVIQLIYEHGTFTASSTYQTALALQAYTIGLAGYSGIKILVPCFYAMQPPRFEPQTRKTFWSSFSHFVLNVVLFTPARVSLIGIAVNLGLCFVLYYWFGLGHVGLALTTGFVAILNFLQLVYAIQKKIDLGAPGDWLSFFARVTVATLACGLVVLFGDQVLLAHRSTHSVLGAMILFLNIILAGAVYFGTTLLLRIPESVELMAIIKRRMGRGRKG